MSTELSSFVTMPVALFNIIWHLKKPEVQVLNYCETHPLPYKLTNYLRKLFITKFKLIKKDINDELHIF